MIKYGVDIFRGGNRNWEKISFSFPDKTTIKEAEEKISTIAYNKKFIYTNLKELKE